MQPLNLSSHLIPHPEETYYVRHGGFVLVIDRAAFADDGDIVIVRLYDQLIVAKLALKDGDELIEFEVWGRVLYVIHLL